MNALILESDPERQKSLKHKNIKLCKTSVSAIKALSSGLFGLISIGDGKSKTDSMELAEYLSLSGYDAEILAHTWNTRQVDYVRELLPNCFYLPYCDTFASVVKKIVTET